MHFSIWIMATSCVLGWLAQPPVRPAAYLDPGSGSYILQLVVAALLGGAFLVKTYWSKIIQFFRNLFSRNKENKPDDR